MIAMLSFLAAPGRGLGVTHQGVLVDLRQEWPLRKTVKKSTRWHMRVLQDEGGVLAGLREAERAQSVDDDRGSAADLEMLHACRRARRPPASE
jgi:hypothetical protein